MSHPIGLPVILLGAICAFVAVLALGQAATWYNHPVGGMFVDPGGVVSNLSLPSWEDRRQGLRFPDTIRTVDGNDLFSKSRVPGATVWDGAVERAALSANPSVIAVAVTASGTREVVLPVRPLEPLAWWLYGGWLILVGAIYQLFGLIALWASPRNRLARTFAKVTVFAGFFLYSLFDFHTSRALVPLFFLSFPMTTVGLVVLALRLPDDVPILARNQWLELALDGVGLAVGATLIWRYNLGLETRPLQHAWTVVNAIAFLFFGATFLARFIFARGIRKERLRALLVATLPPCLVTTTIVVPFPRTDVTEAATFASLGLFPIAAAYAFVRYDLWGSRALLSRVLTRLTVTLVVGAIAVVSTAVVVTRFGIPLLSALLVATVSSTVAVLLVLLALSFVDRTVFPSRTEYKPTVEQLSAELIAITSPDRVARAIERTIQRWLPCGYVEVTLSLAPLPSLHSEEANDEAENRTSKTESRERHAEQLALPIEFGRRELGRLHLGEKRGGALFTDEDLDLLKTIVNQGALALAHARAYEELEARRQDQAAVWRGERAALVETVAAEIAHEIRYPINFFRSVFSTNREGQELDAEELDLGREEVERLERLVSGLRRLALHQIHRQRVSLDALCTRVETLLRDSFGERRLERTVPADIDLLCDPDQATQILVNLVANGLQAAGDEGTVGLAWRTTEKGGELVVWDTGPGFSSDAANLFTPWYTTKPKGTGLGLAITQRLCRAHGWSITARRDKNHTQFVVCMRSEDLATERDDRATIRSAEVA